MIPVFTLLVAALSLEPEVPARFELVEPPAPVIVAGREATLSADDWARPRSGDRVLELDAVRAVVSAWSDHPDDVIVILYPGGEAGSLWASELRDWLVALGLPQSRLELRPGAPADDTILLRVED